MKKTNINLSKNQIRLRPIQLYSSLALVERFNSASYSLSKKEPGILYQLYPINNRKKYPIFFEKLIERINNLSSMGGKHNKNITPFKEYVNVELNRKLINKDLYN